MRPTRFTKQQRVTKFGKGGWHIAWWGLAYTHPVTGDSYATDRFNPFWIKRRRRALEEKRATRQLQHLQRVTFEEK